MFWRIVQAFGASSGMSVGAGVIGDIYRLEERGAAMGVFFGVGVLSLFIITNTLTFYNAGFSVRTSDCSVVRWHRYSLRVLAPCTEGDVRHGSLRIPPSIPLDARDTGPGNS